MSDLTLRELERLTDPLYQAQEQIRSLRGCLRNAQESLNAANHTNAVQATRIAELEAHDAYATKRMIAAEEQLDANKCDEMLTYYSGMSWATHYYEDGITELREQRDALLAAAGKLFDPYNKGRKPTKLVNEIRLTMAHTGHASLGMAFMDVMDEIQAAIALCDKATKGEG